ncbi:MAG TPA: T9SS type A sorting domain-containing protein [Candidatus Eisenbacteria bacterium]|nr:T9SS type A sorting domain-containing protein [Candidatus Eisenbacteria bacterium]
MTIVGKPMRHIASTMMVKLPSAPAPAPGFHPSIVLAPAFQYRDLHDLGADGRAAACAVLRMLWCYTQRDLDGFTACLAPEFRYVSDDPEFMADAPQGFGAEDEASSAAHLFAGVVKQGRRLPAADEIRVTISSIEAAPAAAGDSAAAGALRVTATGVALSIAFEDGSGIATDTARDEFVVVPRGESLRRHWYVSRWEEHATTAAVPVRPTAAPIQASAPRDGPPLELGIAPAANPARGALRVLASLPTNLPVRLELFDVAGRRVVTSTLPAIAGVHTFPVEEARALPSGVYMLRLRQGATNAIARVVLVR